MRRASACRIVALVGSALLRTVNLDAWALYRNSEIMMIARSPEVATLFDERLFAPDIAASKRGEPPSGGRQRIESWLWDKLSYFL